MKRLISIVLCMVFISIGIYMIKEGVEIFIPHNEKPLDPAVSTALEQVLHERGIRSREELNTQGMIGGAFFIALGISGVLFFGFAIYKTIKTPNAGKTENNPYT